MTLLLSPKAFDGSDCSPEADQIPHSAPCPLGAGPLPLPSCPPPAILSVLHQTASAHEGLCNFQQHLGCCRVGSRQGRQTLAVAGSLFCWRKSEIQLTN